jgi:hypothetical protein
MKDVFLCLMLFRDSTVIFQSRAIDTFGELSFFCTINEMHLCHAKT